MNKSFDYYLFDWDGTLCDTLDIWTQAWVETMSEFDIQIDNKQAGLEVFYDWMSLFEEYHIEPKPFCDHIEKLVKPRLTQARLVPQAFDTVKYLHDQGKKLAIVTSSDSRLIRELLVNHQMDQFFSSVVGRNDVNQSKPAPDMLLKALEEMEADRSGAIMVGDMPSDILAGKKVPMFTAVYYSEKNQTIHPKQEIIDSQPDWVIHNLIELQW